MRGVIVADRASAMRAWRCKWVYLLPFAWMVCSGGTAYAFRAEAGKSDTVERAPIARHGAVVPGADQHEAAEAARKSGIAVGWNDRLGTPHSVRGRGLERQQAFSGGKGLVARANVGAEPKAKAVLDNLSRLYRFKDVENEFRVKRVQNDKLGHQHVRLAQQHRGLRVVGGDLVVHFDDHGNAYEVNGSYVAGVEVDVAPKVTGVQAEDLAKANLRAKGLPPGTLAEVPELVVFALECPPRLAYQLVVCQGAGGVPGRWRYWVDATDGTILLRYNDIQRIGPPTDNGSHATITGSVLAGEGGMTTNVTGWYETTGYYYFYNKPLYWYVFNVAASGYPDANTYAFRDSADWGTSDRAEMSLASAFDWTQRYFLDFHGRHSFDDANVYARANVHEGINYVNAYWDGLDFHFGDGDGAVANSLAVLDIAGHEYGHAVTEYTAGLIYYGESGALNESFSDIAGACVEFYAQPDGRSLYPSKGAGTADWFCGEDSWLDSPALRDMRNPTNTATVGPGNEQPSRYHGRYWYYGTGDNGGVHYNSGVQNFMFYLLSEGGSGNNDGIAYSVAGIGWSNAARVAHQALTAYCTPGTDYRAARPAWLSAAEDLDPAWVPSVRAAWSAVGVSALAVDPEYNAEFMGIEGGAFTPLSFVYTLLNTDSTVLGWGASNAHAWVSVAPSEGSIPPFGSQSVTVTVNSAANSLPAGQHLSSVTFTNSTDAGQSVRSVDLRVLPPLIESFPLDTDPGWSRTGEWEFGEPQGNGGEVHGNPDPTAGVSGSNVLGINLAGDYSTEPGPYQYLTAGPFDLSAYTGVTLLFSRWLNTDFRPYVYASIEVSGDGTTWTTVWTNSAGQEIADDHWVQVCLDISAYADGQPSCLIRWGHRAMEDAYPYSGWNLDDIRLYGESIDDLRVSPGTGINSTGYEGGPFDPVSAVYCVSNSGAAALEWTASVTNAWVSALPSTGTLGAGKCTNVTVSFSGGAAALPIGVYTDTVVFSNALSGFTVSRPVVLSVLAMPGEIMVLDSIAPTADRDMPFGRVIMGVSRTEGVTVSNTDLTHDLVIAGIRSGLYEEDFGDGLAQGWVPVDTSHWSVATGEYVAQGAVSDWMQSVYMGESWSNSAAQMKVRRAGAFGFTAALFVRATDNFLPDVSGTAYGVGIANGQFWLAKWVSGVFSWIVPWNSTPLLLPDSETNTVILSVQSNSLALYLNGNLAWSGTDNSVAGPGRVVIAGYSDGATTHYFDDIAVGDPIGAAAGGAMALGDVSEPVGSICRAPAQAPVLLPAFAQGYPPVVTEIPAAFRLVGLPQMPCAIPPGGELTFEVVYAPSSLGSNLSAVVIESNDADEPVIEMDLSGEGIADYLGIVPGAGLVSEGHPGGPFTPVSQVYLLTNNGPVSVSWSSWSTQTWVTVAPAAGTLAPGAGTAVTVSLNTLAAALPEGVHTDTVTFSNLTTTIATNRGVTLTVFTSPIVQVTPPFLTVTNVPGGYTQRTLTVGNAAGADADLDIWLSTRGAAAGGPGFSGIAGGGAAQAPAARDFTKVQNGVAFKPGRLLVRFAPGVGAAARAGLLAQLGGATIQAEYKLVPGLCRVGLKPGQDIHEALTAWNRNSGVLYAEPDYEWKALVTPNDARFGELWGMHNTGQTGGTADADIDAPEAWDVAVGSHDTVVAVIDTGVDYNHEDLAANMWQNPDEIAGNGLDDDGNGFIDDVYGINAITGSGDPLDDHGHGTHCSGTIGGIGGNGVGVAGVCWQVRIMALKFLNAGGSGDTSDAVECIQYATQKGAKVLSNSWGGGGYSQALQDAIDAANATGIVFVAAAGNSAMDTDISLNYPSCHTSANVIAVMATDANDVRAGFSNYGQETVDLAAPGVDILSCANGGGYQTMSGTSMATPHVAGACGLLLSVNPFLTVDQIKEVLLGTVDVPAAPLTCVSSGRMNVARAIVAVGRPWLSASPSVVDGIPPGGSTNITVSFAAGGLAAGTYTGLIGVASNDRETPLTNVPAVMVVLDDDLRITPATAFESSGMRGGPFIPAGMVYELTNAGTAALEWTVEWTQSWVTVVPAGGTLAAGDAVTVSASISGAANAFAAGIYTDLLVFSNRTSGAAYWRAVSLEVSPPPPESIHFFALDTDPGWTVQGDWAFGSPLGMGGDPVSGHTGANVYGYNLAGAYTNNIPVYHLTTPALDCSGYENIQLVFHQWLGVESAVFDSADVQVSTNGTSWTSVWSHTGGSFQESQWREKRFTLPVETRNCSTVYLRWGMGPTDGSIVYSGWNLDDIGLYGDSILTSKGIPEPWLIRHGLTNSAPEEEELLDFDGDGMLNWQEYVSDTNPTNKESFLSLLDVRRQGDSAQIEWKGGQKARQYVEVCESLDSAGVLWRSVYTNSVIPTALTNICTDSTLTNALRYYRIRVER